MIYGIFGAFDRLSTVILIILNNYIGRTPHSSTVTLRQLVNLKCGEAQAAGPQLDLSECCISTEYYVSLIGVRQDPGLDGDQNYVLRPP